MIVFEVPSFKNNISVTSLPQEMAIGKKKFKFVAAHCKNDGHFVSWIKIGDCWEFCDGMETPRMVSFDVIDESALDEHERRLQEEEGFSICSLVYELVRGEGDNTCKVAGEVINVDEVETDSETDNEDDAEFPDLKKAKRVSRAKARERKRQEESSGKKEAEVRMSFRNTNNDNIVADLSWMSKKHLRERSRKRRSRKKRVPKKRSKNESIAG